MTTSQTSTCDSGIDNLIHTQKALICLASLLCLTLGSISEASIVIQKIDENGDVKKISGEFLSEHPDQLRFTDPLDLSSIHFKVIDGSADLVRVSESEIVIELHSQVAIFTFDPDFESDKNAHSYYIERPVSHGTFSKTSEVHFTLKTPITVSAGLTGQTYQNTYTVHPSLNKTWSGPQIRFMVDGRTSSDFWEKYTIRVHLRIDAFNPSLSQQFQAYGTLERAFMNHDDWEDSVGLGVHTLATLGGAPYGFDPSASPLVQFRAIKNQDYGFTVTYAPFFSGGIDFGSAYMSLMYSKKMNLFSQKWLGSLGVERVTVPETASKTFVNYQNLGAFVTLGKTFGEAK